MKTLITIALLLTTACAGARFGEGPRPATQHFESSLAACHKAAYRMAPHDLLQYRAIKIHCMDQLGYAWERAQYIVKPDLVMAKEIADAAEE